MGIDGNETADQLARKGSSRPLRAHDPALGISAKVANGVIKDWTKSTGSLYMDKGRLNGFLKKPCVTKTGELLSRSRNQLTIMTGFLR